MLLLLDGLYGRCAHVQLIIENTCTQLGLTIALVKLVPVLPRLAQRVLAYGVGV